VINNIWIIRSTTEHFFIVSHLLKSDKKLVKQLTNSNIVKAYYSSNAS